jgi:hypothetical protein
MLIAELITKTGPIYVNADHVIYLHRDIQDPESTHIHFTHPKVNDIGRITVKHTPLDVVQRLYKGLE